MAHYRNWQADGTSSIRQWFCFASIQINRPFCYLLPFINYWENIPLAAATTTSSNNSQDLCWGGKSSICERALMSPQRGKDNADKEVTAAQLSLSRKKWPIYIPTVDAMEKIRPRFQGNVRQHAVYSPVMTVFHIFLTVAQIRNLFLISCLAPKRMDSGDWIMDLGLISLSFVRTGRC